VDLSRIAPAKQRGKVVHVCSPIREDMARPVVHDDRCGVSLGAWAVGPLALQTGRIATVTTLATAVSREQVLSTHCAYPRASPRSNLVQRCLAPLPPQPIPSLRASSCSSESRADGPP